jgi:chorismate-pyruvate lyase
VPEPVFAKLKNRQRDRGLAVGLVDRHFVMQDERPADVRAVEIEALDPFLRGLLFTDGTVTRTLAVQMLAPVAVEPIGQLPVPTPTHVAECLEAPPREESIRRRVGIGIGAPPTPVLWAESFIIPERLPPGFVGLLDSAPDGIGQSLQRFSLESSRELCWFGLAPVPAWAPDGPGAAADTVLCRLYRIVSDGRPAILISEHFAVTRRDGVYHLTGLLAHEAARAEERGSE